MTQLRKWADEHQYDAEPQPGVTEHNGVMPSVHLIHMTEDPLGVMAAHNGIYKGKVYRSLAEVTDDARRQALDDMTKTTLQAPLETINMHFLFEGVDRAFTHQHVRQRTANFGQESLRFSVVGPLIDATTLPPQLHGTERAFVAPDFNMMGQPDSLSFDDIMGHDSFSYMNQDDRNRTVWDWAIQNVDAAYHYLVEHGVAAEEARGLLPHATATRIHYETTLRGLLKLMGERLCTQAQFHWKLVAAHIKNAVRNYTPDFSWAGMQKEWMTTLFRNQYGWQFELLADSQFFQPVCYQTGRCMFQASADRGCTIRERVEHFASLGIPSSRWHETDPDRYYRGIDIREWLMDPGAARKRTL